MNSRYDPTILIRRLHIGIPILTASHIFGTRGVQAECKAGYPTGYFAGAAISKQAGKLDVSLNLRCADGHYEGELVTPVGTYSVEEGSFNGAVLHLQLGAGGDHLIVEAHLDTEVLKGTFIAGDDTGPLELRRTREGATLRLINTDP